MQLDADCISTGFSDGDCETPGVGAVSEIGKTEGFRPDETGLAETGAGIPVLPLVALALLLVWIGLLLMAAVRKWLT